MINRLDKRIQKAEADLLKAIARKSKVIGKVQDACTHPIVAEAPYHKNEYLPSCPPFRVCETCGLHEDGWGCGYQLLRNTDERRVFNVSREVGYEMRSVR